MDWLSTNWGNLLSALGVIISLATLHIAQSVGKAVAATRNDMKRESVSYYMTNVYHTAQEIETFLSLGAYPAALVRSRDLGKSLGYIVRRWEEMHLPSTLMVLVESKTQVDSLANRLQRITTVLSRSEQTKLLDVIQQVTSKLGEEKAAADARADQ